MLVAVLDPEIYLKSARTQRRMLRILTDNLRSALDERVEVRRIAGHRLEIRTDSSDAADRAARVFGVSAVEQVEPVRFDGLDDLAAAVARHFAAAVGGRTFAVRPRRLGSHDWRSQDLAVAAGTLLVRAGGRVDLSDPEVTVAVRVVDDTAYLTTRLTPAVGGLPLRSQGRALMLFSGGIDSPVAAYMVQRRGVALDHVHFSFGCGEADHAAGVAHELWSRYGRGAPSSLIVVDFEHVAAAIPERVAPRDRQMALKAAMYLAAARVASTLRGARALVTGESLGQVSTQTLDNLVALDHIAPIPVLRPLLGLSKQEIRDRAEALGTYSLSARTRELCDISGGTRVAVSTTGRHLQGVAGELHDLVDLALDTAKHTDLADWTPGGTG